MYYPSAPYPTPNYIQGIPPPNYQAVPPPAVPSPGTPPTGFSPEAPPPNTSGPPQVIFVPYTDHAAIAKVELMARENEQLNARLHQKAQRDQALTKVYENWDHSLFLFSPSGHPIQILNCKPESCYHIIPTPPSRRSEEYILYLRGIDDPLRLSANDYLSDRKLCAALQEIPGVTVPQTRLSQKVQMSLLRGVFGVAMTTLQLDYYGGWKQSEDESIHFWSFENGGTHLHPKWIEEPQLCPEYCAAQAAVAAGQFYPVFEAIQEPFARSFVFVWFHLAALHTLLKVLGFPVLLSTSFFVTDRDVQTFIKRVFAWHGDKPISLDQPPADFVQKLLSRKDQPLLVVDHGRLQNAVSNARTLEEAIVTHQVPWKLNRNAQTLPIQAPITICADRASALSCAPEVINLDLGLQDFDWKVLREFLDQSVDSREYLEGFLGFAEMHCADLRTMLNEGLRHARKVAFVEMGEECVLMLGIFIGMVSFLKAFFESCNLDAPPVDLSDDALIDSLRSLLNQTSEKYSLLSISDMFAAIVRKQIRKGTLTATLKSKGGGPLPTTVFYDDDFVYFPTPAFRSVCQAMDQNQTTILHALMDDGALGGKPINGTTPQTRITIKGLYRSLPVYAVDRSLIEPFGDQVFEEGIL